MTALAFASCSAGDDSLTTTIEQTAATPVTFQLAQQQPGATRATYDDTGTWTAGQAVGVKCTADNENRDLNDIKKYVTQAAGNSVTLEGDDEANTFYFFNQATASKSFALWFPYSASLPTGMEVDADQTSADLEDYDLMYAEVAGVTASSAATANFYHQMSRLTVIVTKGDGTETDETVTSVTLGDGNVAVTGTATLAASHYNATASTTGASWTPGTQEETVTLKSITGGYSCILPPQTIGSATTVLLSITTNKGKTYTYKHSEAYTLLPGVHHTINATISRVGITITVGITDWTPGTGATETIIL